jgi:hypothetical protein
LIANAVAVPTFVRAEVVGRSARVTGRGTGAVRIGKRTVLVTQPVAVPPLLGAEVIGVAWRIARRAGRAAIRVGQWAVRVTNPVAVEAIVLAEVTQQADSGWILYEARHHHRIRWVLLPKGQPVERMAFTYFTVRPEVKAADHGWMLQDTV